METDSVSQTLCFLLNYLEFLTKDKAHNPLIQSIMHYPQKPLGSASIASVGVAAKLITVALRCKAGPLEQ
jgi:hypothetical protein